MSELKTLYKVDTTGKIRQWTVNINNDTFWTEQGQVDGKIVVNKPTFTTPKNEGRSNATTAEEQAILEAQAKWTKQTDKGYVERIEDVHKITLYTPMLAQKFEDRSAELEFPLFTQPKLDGIRCITYLQDGELVAKSRAGKPIEAIPHILEELESFFAKNPDAVLDGELYNHDLKNDFNKIISLVRKMKPVRSASDTDKSFDKKLAKFETALSEAKDKVQYWIYDAPRIGDYNESELFSVRSRTLTASIASSKSLVIVPTHTSENLDDVDERYNEYMSEGYEGQMVRVDFSYENKRSKKLLKRKDFTDSEYLVIGIEEGDGNRTGTAKNLTCKDEATGKTFNSNIKGTHEYLAEILENKDYYIGQQATIKYFELTPDGIPRFPYAIAFRDYE
jgi:DNA ligase-1